MVDVNLRKQFTFRTDVDAHFGLTSRSNNNRVVTVSNQSFGLERNGYCNKKTSVVLGLPIIQLMLGLTCFISQIITTTIGSDGNKWSIHAYEGRGTGIWVGLSIIVTASIGIVGSKQNKTTLIATYLGFNAVLLPLTIISSSTAGISILWLKYEVAPSNSEAIWMVFAGAQVIASCLTFIISLTLLICSRSVLRACICYERSTGQSHSNMEFPVGMAYNGRGVQKPVIYPTASVSDFPNSHDFTQGVPMPPPYEAHTSDFHPPPEYYP